MGKKMREAFSSWYSYLDDDDGVLCEGRKGGGEPPCIMLLVREVIVGVANHSSCVRLRCVEENLWLELIVMTWNEEDDCLAFTNDSNSKLWCWCCGWEEIVAWFGHDGVCSELPHFCATRDEWTKWPCLPVCATDFALCEPSSDCLEVFSNKEVR